MSTIERFYTTTFTVYRLAYVANKGSYSSNGTFLGHIQQAQAELQEQLVDMFSRMFIVWCAVGTDIQEGDRINDGTNDYKVKAVRLNNVGANTHLEVVVHKNK